MHCSTRSLILFCCLVLPISLAQAWSYGVINTTQRPGDSGNGCASCHGASPGVVDVQLQGREAILPGAGERYSVTVGNISNASTRGGFTIAITKNAASQPVFANVPGEPTATADGNTQIVNNNNVNPLRLPSKAAVTYLIDLDVPASATLGEAYTLYAVGDAGHGTTQVGWNFAQPLTISIGPPVPEALVADQEAASLSEIPLSWLGSDQGEHFRILGKTGEFPENPTDPDALLIYEGPATGATATGLSSGTQYFFAAYGKVPDEAHYSTAAALADAASLPEDPGALEVNPLSGSEIELDWSGSASEYRLLRKVSEFPASPEDPDAELVFEGSGISVVDSGLAPEISYRYRLWGKVPGLAVFSSGSSQVIWSDLIHFDRFEQTP